MPDNTYRKTRVPGIYSRNGYYHLRKRYQGVPISGPTGVPEGRGKLKEAEAILLKRMEEVRQVLMLGKTPSVDFEDAGLEYCSRNSHKATIDDFEKMCARLSDHYLGGVPVQDVHQDHPMVQKLIRDLLEGTTSWIPGRGHRVDGTPKPRKKKTVKAYIEVIVRILNFCTREWRDPVTGEHYLKSVPRFRLDHIQDDERSPVALTWDQQRLMEKELPAHLQRVLLYGVNSGLRDFEITNLRWKWLKDVPGCDKVFVIPGYYEGTKITKNGRARVSIVNSVCRSILDELAGNHEEFVFTYDGEPIGRIVNTGWTNARARAGKKDPALSDIHFHDCRHTFGHRLELAGVDPRTKKILLGHHSREITDHYTQLDLHHLQTAAELVTLPRKSVPVLSLTGGLKNG